MLFIIKNIFSSYTYIQENKTYQVKNKLHENQISILKIVNETIIELNAKLKNKHDVKYALFYDKSPNLNLSKKQWKCLIDNSDLSLIKDKEDLIEFKKIQSELLNNDILNKIDITKDSNKKVKI